MFFCKKALQFAINLILNFTLLLQYINEEDLIHIDEIEMFLFLSKCSGTVNILDSFLDKVNCMVFQACAKFFSRVPNIRQRHFDSSSQSFFLAKNHKIVLANSHVVTA